MNSFLWYWFLLECEFRLISVCFQAHITNMYNASKNLFNTAIVQRLYYLLNVIHNFSPKFSLALNLSSCFFKMAVLLLQNMPQYTALESLINFFWLVAGPMIEQQQRNFNKFSLNLTRYQKIVAPICLHAILSTMSKKKTRTRVQMKDIKQKN